MNIAELLKYIEYLENFKEQLILDQQQYLSQQLDVLKMLAAKLNETLSIFAYATIYNEGELRFPKAYFELHKESLYGLDFDQKSDDNFVIIRLLDKAPEEAQENETESVSTD
jgi:hypothetical protein